MCSTDGHELDGLSDGALLGHVKQLVAEQNRISARLTRAVRAAENRQSAEHDGLKSMRSWLRTHTRVSDRAARQMLETGRALESLPATEAAFAAGRIGAEQVAALAPVVTARRLEQATALGVDVPAVEAELVGIAEQLSHQRLRAAVHFYTARLDPDGTEPDPTEGRQLTLARLLDGTWTGTFTLDAVGGEKVATALEAIAAAARCAGDTRTAARTGMDTRISAATARRLARDATLSRMPIDADGLPLDVGRDHRVVPPHLRRAVVERDRHCVFTGCDAPPWFCDVHHLLEWINVGQTSLDNSGLLCERHHTKIHHGYRIERDDTAPPDHRWRTWRPDGTEILLHPPLLAA